VDPQKNILQLFFYSSILIKFISFSALNVLYKSLILASLVMKKNMKYLILFAFVTLFLSTPHTSHGAESESVKELRSDVPQLPMLVELQEPIKQDVVDLNQLLEIPPEEMSREALEVAFKTTISELEKAKREIKELNIKLEAERHRPYQETLSFKEYIKYTEEQKKYAEEQKKKKMYSFSPKQEQVFKNALLAMEELENKQGRTDTKLGITYDQLHMIFNTILEEFPKPLERDRYGVVGGVLVCNIRDLNTRLSFHITTKRNKGMERIRNAPDEDGLEYSAIRYNLSDLREICTPSS